jgi:hypothetical protein
VTLRICVTTTTQPCDTRFAGHRGREHSCSAHFIQDLGLLLCMKREETIKGRCQGARNWFIWQAIGGTECRTTLILGDGAVAVTLLCFLLFITSSFLSFRFTSHMLHARGWKTKVTIPRLLWVDEVISVQSSFAGRNVWLFFLFAISHRSHSSWTLALLQLRPLHYLLHLAFVLQSNLSLDPHVPWIVETLDQVDSWARLSVTASCWRKHSILFQWLPRATRK